MVDCRSCNARSRSDQLNNGKCPECGSTDLTEPRPFNLMFKTSVGPIDDGTSFAYLRPETFSLSLFNVTKFLIAPK